jgi:UDP-glucuronate decarboxylase
MKSYSTVVGSDVEGLANELSDVLPSLSGKTLLVTGASGFLMSYIVDVAMAANAKGLNPRCRVIALDNHKTGVPERLAHLDGRPDFIVLKHDVTVPLDVKEPIHYIVHGASIASPIVYRQFPLETISANVDGTRNMLELARTHGVAGMIIMSTSEIYGDPDPRFIPTPEDYRGYVSSTGPRACYDESKRLAETLGMTYFRLFNTPIKLIRPFNVYGPGLRLDDQRVLPDFISCALTGKPIEILSSGTPTRSFCYISDATSLMFRTLLADFSGDAINVGNDEIEISMSGLAKLVSDEVARLLNTKPVDVRQQVSDDPEYLTDNPQRRCPDLTRARTLFPTWKPRVSIEEGIRRYVVHALEKQQPTAAT